MAGVAFLVTGVVDVQPVLDNANTIDVLPAIAPVRLADVDGPEVTVTFPVFRLVQVPGAVVVQFIVLPEHMFVLPVIAGGAGLTEAVATARQPVGSV